MIKKILLITLFSNLCVNAQVKEKNDIEVSALIGLASSDYYGHSLTNDFKAIYTPTFGINADYYTNNRWSFRIGLEYRTFGAKMDDFNSLSFKTEELKHKLNYVFIPIHANWHFGSKRNWNLHFGPSVSFLESASFNGVKTTKENLSNTQIGLGLGIGYKFELSEKFSLAIEHQEYISFMNSYERKPYNVYFGNIGGSFNVRFIYNLDKSKNDK